VILWKLTRCLLRLLLAYYGTWLRLQVSKSLSRSIPCMIVEISSVLSYTLAPCYTISIWHVVIDLSTSWYIRQSHSRLSKTSYFKPYSRQISRRCNNCFWCYSNSQEQSTSPSLLSNIHTSRLPCSISIRCSTPSILFTFPRTCIRFIRGILRWTWTASETLCSRAPQIYLALGVRSFFTFWKIRPGPAPIFWT